MPRANRHYVAGQVWHITHRCHQREFLLRFSPERKRWLYWLFQARRRFGLSVLNYSVTCNHIHLLVQDRGNDEIAPSMQLIAGRTAQEFNRRKGRRGAFWEDRYHATAVETDSHLARCMVYIDFNMVRAGVVAHPRDWKDCGYHEIQNPRARASRISYPTLINLFGFSDRAELQRQHRSWVTSQLRDGPTPREPAWSESVAVGGRLFTESFRAALGASNPGRKIYPASMGYAVREATLGYWLD